MVAPSFPPPSVVDEYDTERWNDLTNWLSSEVSETADQLDAEEATEHPSILFPLTHRVRPSTALSQASLGTSTCSGRTSPLPSEQLFFNPDDVQSRHSRTYTPPLVSPLISISRTNRPPPMDLEGSRAGSPLHYTVISHPHTSPHTSLSAFPSLPPSPALSSSHTSLNFTSVPSSPIAAITPLPPLVTRPFSPVVLRTDPVEPPVSLVRSWLEIAKHIGHMHSPRSRQVVITGRNFKRVNETLLRRWLENATRGKISSVTLVTNDHDVYPEWHITISKICKLSEVFNISKKKRIEVPRIGLLTVTWPEREAVTESILPTAGPSNPILRHRKSFPKRIFEKSRDTFKHS